MGQIWEKLISPLFWIEYSALVFINVIDQLAWIFILHCGLVLWVQTWNVVKEESHLLLLLDVNSHIPYQLSTPTLPTTHYA